MANFLHSLKYWVLGFGLDQIGICFGYGERKSVAEFFGVLSGRDGYLGVERRKP
jgi:hypothetical protein